MENTELIKKANLSKKILFIVMIIIIMWFSLTVYEFYRVKSDKRPIICMFKNSDKENDLENSMTCYGLFYKYKEYSLIENNVIDAREFTMFFIPFDRDPER